MGKLRVVMFMLAVALSGCVSNPSIYTWGKYEKSLYKYYKNPDALGGYVESLDAVIKAGEKTGNVPPGMYAEAGYGHFVSGRLDTAIQYFEKESAKWPESSYFMGKMIENVKASSSGGNSSE